MRTPTELREAILNLLEQKNISAHKMLVECGLNKSIVNDLKKGQMPSADKIAVIARYLGVSTDFLLGNYGLDSFGSEEDFLTGLRLALYGTSAQKLSEYDKKNIIELAEMLVKMRTRENRE